MSIELHEPMPYRLPGASCRASILGAIVECRGVFSSLVTGFLRLVDVWGSTSLPSAASLRVDTSLLTDAFSAGKPSVLAGKLSILGVSVSSLHRA